MKAIEMKAVSHNTNEISYRYQGKTTGCGHGSEKRQAFFQDC